MIEDLHSHFERPDVVAEYASFEFLLRPEKVIFGRFKPWIEGGRVLDIGVGAGRTTPHLAPVAAHYLGTDVSKAMIEACRVRFPTREGMTFEVLDARDMRSLQDESFDFVLFSFNGLDLVGDHRSRLAALTEMRRVCRKGGVICFSTENLGYAEMRLSYGKVLLDALRRTKGQPARRALKMVRRAMADVRTWRRLNPSRAELAKLEHAMIRQERVRQEFSPRFFANPGERIRVERCFVRPTAQVRQLASAGFEEVTVFDADGGEVEAPALHGVTHHWWHYYTAVRSADAGSDRTAKVREAPRSAAGSTG